MKTIPNTDGYFADETGKIFDKDLKELTYYSNLDGYVTAMIMVNGSPVTIGVHRLVLSAFDRPPSDEECANHIDGNVKNNHKENLEWATVQENNVHATLLNRFTKRPLIVGTFGETILYLNDLNSASEYFDVDIGTVWDSIKNRKLIKGWLLEHLKSSDKRVAALKNIKPNTPTTYRKGIYVKSLINDKVTYYNSRTEFAKERGVKQNNVSQQISTPDYIKVFQKEFVIIEHSPDFEFITESIKQELLSRGGKEVIVFNVKTKTISFSKSAYDFIKTFKLSKKAVTTALKNKKLKLVGEYLFSYRSDFNKEVREQMIKLADEII